MRTVGIPSTALLAVLSPSHNEVGLLCCVCISSDDLPLEVAYVFDEGVNLAMKQ